MFKKIVSIFLAALMLLSFPVFAEETTEAVAVTDSGNMQFAKALEIIPADAVGTDTVTRLDFAKMFCGIFRTDIGLGSSQGIAFTDVPAEATSAVAQVSSMGIMNGVGGGLFAPESPVTYAQALKAMVTFLGYGQNAEDMGGYPYGYYAQATSLGLTANAPADMNAELTFERAVSLFKLAINVDFREPVSFNPDPAYKAVKDLTYLQYYRNIVRIRGRVRSTSVSDISGMGKTAYNQIRIESDIFGFEPAKLNASDYFGYEVDAYVNLDTEKIHFIEDVGTTKVVNISSTQISGLEGDDILYFGDGDKVKKLPINASTRIIYNGTNLPSYTENDINPFAYADIDGGITVIENTGDKYYDIVIVDAYETLVVDKVVGTKIFAENTSGVIIDLDDEDYIEGETYLLFNIIDEPIRLSSIKEGDTLSVSRDRNGNITKIVVTIDNLTGTISARHERNGRVFITVNGQAFECTNAVSAAIIADPTIADFGKKTCISFDKDGLVSHIEQDEYDIWNTGYLVDYATENGLDARKLVKIFGDDGVWYIYTIAEKIYINESTTPVADSALIATAGTVDGVKVIRQPILYKVNPAGELRSVIFPDAPPYFPPYSGDDADTAAKNQYAADILANGAEYIARYDDAVNSPLYMYQYTADGVTYICDGNTTLNATNEETCFSGKIFLIDSATIFNIPSEENRDVEEQYSIRSSNIITNTGYKGNVALYGTDPRPVADIAVVVDAASETIHVETYSLVVESLDTYMDDKDEIAYRVTGYLHGKQVTYTDPKGLLLECPGGALPESGDVLRFSVDSRGQILKVDYAFDASEQVIYNNGISCGTNGMNTTSYIAGPRYTYGEAMYIDEEIMLVDVLYNDEHTTESFLVPKQVFVKVTKDARGQITIEPAKYSDIIGSEQYSGGEPSKVFVHTKAGRAWGVVIYEGF